MNRLLLLPTDTHVTDDKLQQINAVLDRPLDWHEDQNILTCTYNEPVEMAHVQAIRTLLAPEKIDFFSMPENFKAGLFLADMDSTIVDGETLDELAEKCGFGDKVAEITESAMRGELDFKNALNQRVALLKDYPVTLLEDVWAEIKYNNGAPDLLRDLKTHDVYCVLVSGGFTFFTGKVAEELVFDEHHGNHLLHAENKLTGTVGMPVLGKEAKLALLQKLTRENPDKLSVAIGDGANDLPMLLAADLGIGYRPKPLIAENITNCLFYNDLAILGKILTA